VAVAAFDGGRATTHLSQIVISSFIAFVFLSSLSSQLVESSFMVLTRDEILFVSSSSLSLSLSTQEGKWNACGHVIMIVLEFSCSHIIAQP
jgi:hypothetical protein